MMRVVKPWHRLPRGGRCPIPGNFQGQVGWGSEQPDPAEDVPAHGRGLDEIALKDRFQHKLFYDSSSFG